MENEKIIKFYETLSSDFKIFGENENDWEANGLSDNDFKSLVSVMLSTMTHTKRVIRAAVALYEVATTPQEIVKLSDEELIELIKPVAHYNRKTKHLKEMSQQLLDRHEGKVPRTEEKLLALQGVGRKCASIMLNFNFGENIIAVDSHVHRVLNRVGILKTKTNEQTAEIINKITPLKFKKHAHEWIIQQGMNTCTARKPKCSDCSLITICSEYKLMSNTN